jgi:hypothetical protein
VEATVQALLVAVVNDPAEKVRPCNLQKLINSLQLKKACRIGGIPNECLRHLQTITEINKFLTIKKGL